MLDWRSLLPDGASECPVATFLPAYQGLVFFHTGIYTQHGPEDSLLVQKWKSCGYSFKTNSKTSLMMTDVSRWQVTFKVLFPWTFNVSNFCQPQALLVCLIPGSCTFLKPGAELPFLFSSVLYLLIFFAVLPPPLNKGSSVTPTPSPLLFKVLSRCIYTFVLDEFNIFLSTILKVSGLLHKFQWFFCPCSLFSALTLN